MLVYRRRDNPSPLFVFLILSSIIRLRVHLVRRHQHPTFVLAKVGSFVMYIRVHLVSLPVETELLMQQARAFVLIPDPKDDSLKVIQWSQSQAELSFLSLYPLGLLFESLGISLPWFDPSPFTYASPSSAMINPEGNMISVATVVPFQLKKIVPKVLRFFTARERSWHGRAGGRGGALSSV